MAIVWFLVFYIGMSMVAGAIIGGMAGAAHPQNSAQAGYEAGYDFGQKYGGWMLLASLIISIAGTATGKLPGTHKKQD